MEIKDLKTYQRLTEIDIKLVSQIDTVYNAVKETINSISGCYNNYTMHDMGHGLRVALYMEQIAFGLDGEFDESIKEFSAFELALLILSAILHDIGMFIRPEDKEKIKNNEIKYTTSLSYKGVLKTVGNDENEAVKEIVRITHAQRIKEFTEYDFGGKTISNILMLDDKYPYVDDVIDICIAHGENYDYLRNLRKDSAKGRYRYNSQYIAAILRIADYLDLDKQRTPVLWYKMMKIDGFSKEEWEKHFIIHNEVKLKKYIDNKIQIFFDGKSSNAKIHRKYLSYIDELKSELENAEELLNTKTTEEKYLFRISTKIEDNVVTEGFKYSDLRLNLNYSAITELLMGKNIYGDSRLGLREIIQNSIDACRLMNEIRRRGTDIMIEPQVFVTFSEKENYVKIKDTGVGMTLDIVKKHFLNIGKSYYKSNEYIYENYQCKPIGQYGIGFLSCFLLSDNVIVKTKYYKNNEINQIELEKNSEYVVTNTEETGSFVGTEIILEYDKFFKVFSSPAELISFIEIYFNTEIPIKIKSADDETEYISLKNSAPKYIQNRMLKDVTGKSQTIICEEYSDIIKGKLELIDEKRKKSFEIRNLRDANVDYYWFDSTNNKLSRLNNGGVVDQYCHILRYGDIDENAYSIISKTRKQNKNKRNEILAHSKEIYFLIPDTNDLGIGETSDSKIQFTVNNLFVKEIIENSGLKYYEELIDETEYFENIFLYDDKYIYIQGCHVGEYYFVRDEDIEKSSFYFYNRGIWIRRYGFTYCRLPYAFKCMGVVDYYGDDIKLDVSRNMIISGERKLSYEFANIILKYMEDKENSAELKLMLERIIKYNENAILDQ